MLIEPLSAQNTDQLLNAIFDDAHTARKFLPEPAPIDAVRKAYEHVRWAPTEFNVQPLRLDLFASPDARAELVPFMLGGNANSVASAPLTIVISADTHFHESVGQIGAADKVVKMFADDAEARLTKARNSAWLQLGYLVTVLRAQGWDLGVMTGAKLAAIDEKYHLENGWRAIAVMNVGHASGDEAFAPRQGRHGFTDISVVH